MKLFLGSLAALAAGVGLAAAYVPAPAVTSGSVTVSAQSLDADLSAIDHSPGYSCYLKARGYSAVDGAGTSVTAPTSTVAMGFADQWLTQMVEDALRENLLAKDGVALTQADVALGRAALTRQVQSGLQAGSQASSGTPDCSTSSSVVLSALPASFVAEQTLATTDQLVLAARALQVDLGPSGLASYYAANQASFDKVCLGILEFVTVTRADKADAAITGGTAFATEEAAIEHTTSTSTKQAAGTRCFQLTGSTTTPVITGEVGQVAGPLKAGNAYIIAVVQTRTTQPLSSVRGLVITAIITAGTKKVDPKLARELAADHIAVDPRYGQVATSGSKLIVAPASPPSTSVLSVAADEPISALG